MKKFFLSDKGNDYSYLEFLESINKADSYIPVPKEQDLYKYFVNLVIALINHNSITLVDSDLSEAEIQSIGLTDINKSIPFKGFKLSSNEELSFKISNSKSKITIFTSGTTGQPKQVTHDFYNLARAVRTDVKHSNDIWGFAYNPTHMAGLQVFLQAICNGNTLVNLFNKSRNEVYNLIDKYGVSHLSATPTFYRLLLPYERYFNKMKRITFGGEKSDQRLYENIKKIFPKAKVTNVYASTEAGSLFAANGSDFKIPDSIKDRIKVIEEELYIHKSLIGHSSSLKLENEFYPSGDLIEWIDEPNGIFRFKSRKNELINVGGYKVNPHEVEDAIRAVRGVQDVRVYGKSNSVLGNILCADIVVDHKELLSDLAIRKELVNSLQDFKIPRRIKIVEELNLTRTGKLKR